LNNQTVKIDKLFVVNNGSTDGTTEWLKQQNDIFVINQENVGGAGGFHTGVKYSFENGADWIWMMDDDVFPDEDALFNLLLYKDISECLMPTRYYKDGVKLSWGYFYDIKKRTITNGSRPKECMVSKNFYPINTGCFEGMLISRNIVEHIGYPDPRFFISGDDTVYGLKAARYTNLILVEKAILRKEQISTEKKISPMYLYYMYRNFYLFEEFCMEVYKIPFSFRVKLINLYSIFVHFIEILRIDKIIAFKALKYMIIGVYHSSLKLNGMSHPKK
jgi:GT2 family glycosyltransferase